MNRIQSPPRKRQLPPAVLIVALCVATTLTIALMRPGDERPVETRQLAVYPYRPISWRWPPDPSARVPARTTDYSHEDTMSSTLPFHAAPR